MEKDKLIEEIEGIFDKRMEDLKQYVDSKINAQNTMIKDLLSNLQTGKKAEEIVDRGMDQFIEDLAYLQKDFVGAAKDITCIKSDMNFVRDYIIRVDKKINDE